MYRTSAEYEEICRVIIQIYIDYNLKELPIDEKVVCKKLGVSLMPYSTFDLAGKELLKKKSKLGFFVTKNNEPIIYYNDDRDSLGEIRFTIFHELKHFIFEDKDDEKDDLADFFARFFMCPIPYLLFNKIDTIEKIMEVCGTSRSAAENACSNILSRRSWHGDTIFDYEIPLIEQLNPTLVEIYNLKN